jgi:fatty acid desaturase
MSRTEEPAEAREAGGRPRESRPMIERIGLAAIALVLALLFGAVAVASWFGGELFLAVMGAIGSLMTVWVGAATLFRG